MKEETILISSTPEGIVYAMTAQGLILMAGGNNKQLLESISDPTAIEFLGIKIRTLKPERLKELETERKAP